MFAVDYLDSARSLDASISADPLQGFSLQGKD
jgi:hypothetical protein